MDQDITHLVQSEPFIIIFDGMCSLCEASVLFIIKRDGQAKFKFVQAQSHLGKTLQSHFGIDALRDETMILIKHQQVFTSSSAAIRIAWQLDGVWKLLSASWIIPLPLRNILYNVIARHRYIWFGRKSHCMLPTKETSSRFLTTSKSP